MKTLTETMRSTIDSMNSVTEAYTQGELKGLRNALDAIDSIREVCERLGCNADILSHLEQACESLELELREMTGARDEPMWPRW
jgi:hypothetical protein